MNVAAPMRVARVAILISGNGSNMAALLDAMAANTYPAEPVLVISDTKAARGIARAQQKGVATAIIARSDYPTRADFEAALYQKLCDHCVDIICLAGFMRILSPDFVAKFAGKILNIHPSLLPKYKGLNTHARALAAGDSEAGCSVHIVTAKLDDGPVIGQARVKIAADDTADTLAARVLQAEHQLYAAALRRFIGGLRAVESADIEAGDIVSVGGVNHHDG